MSLKKKKIILDNKLSQKNYYHPDSLILKNWATSLTTTKTNNSSISSANSLYVHAISKDSILPSLKEFEKRETSRREGKEKKYRRSLRVDTEPIKESLIDETMNEVLYSLQNLRTSNNNSTLLTDENSREYSKRPVRKPNKINSERIEKEEIQNRLIYLNKMYPNPENRLPRLKPQVSMTDDEGNTSQAELLLKKLTFQGTKRSPLRKRTKQKNTSQLWNSNSNKNTCNRFFIELNVDKFLSGFTENLTYLEKIKNNKRVVAGILQSFLEFTPEIGKLLLTKDRKEVKNNIKIEDIKARLSKVPSSEDQNTGSNENIYDMEFLIKLYYFNQSILNFLERFHKESIFYQNEIYTEDVHKMKRDQEKYLNDLKHKNFSKFRHSRNYLLNPGEYVGSDNFSVGLLQNIENLENSIGKFGEISAKTRLVCKYTDNLIAFRSGLLIKN